MENALRIALTYPIPSYLSHSPTYVQYVLQNNAKRDVNSLSHVTECNNKADQKKKENAFRIASTYPIPSYFITFSHLCPIRATK